MYETRPDNIPVELENEFAGYALEQFPFEACAVIKDGKLVPVPNIHETPLTDFRFDATHAIGAEAILHSHPDVSVLEPTASDMVSQIATDIPWAIVSTSFDSVSKAVWWGDHLLDVPLKKRQFIHGVFDCYSLIRAYFWQQNSVFLPDFARDFDWWANNEDLYMENFEKVGFKIINSKDVKPGDCFMSRENSKKVNHAGVIVEDGLLLHHVQGKYSGLIKHSLWKSHIDLYVRFNG